MEKLLRLLIVTALVISGSDILCAQGDAEEIKVMGRVRDERGQPISNTIIINRRTRSGIFGRPDGSFEIQCRRSDTLTVTSLGYTPRTVCFSDSILKETYTPTLYLDQRAYLLPQAEIFAPRDLEKIQAEIGRLGYDEKDYMLSGINAVKSPITFLYQQFSKREESRRLVAEMENDDLRRELLKDLFHHYVDYQIIDHNDSEFDEFIDYIDVSDEFLKQSSQYDFLLYVKDRFRDYKIWKRRKSLQERDYNYDHD